MSNEKQMQIPGTGKPRIEAIDKAAEDYRSKRDARMAAGKLEVEARKKLIDLLHHHQITDLYEYDIEITLEDGGKDTKPMQVKFKRTEKISVREANGDEDEETGEEGE
jgi:hypothetical protein